jgi:hypothetical protein
MDQFRHGTIVCSCGFRTTRCACCPTKMYLKPNICLSCQTALVTPNVVPQAIAALTMEAERLRLTDQYLYPNDPNNRRSGAAISPMTFLEVKDKHALLLETGCDWFYWSRRWQMSVWRELDNWQPWRFETQENCADCRAALLYGFISMPASVILCPGCKEVLDRAKEAQCRKIESSSGP